MPQGDKGPRTRGTAQEGGLPREYRGCPGWRRGGADGAGPGKQWGRVNYRRHGAHLGCSCVKTRICAHSSRPDVSNQVLIFMDPPNLGGL